MTFVGVTLLNVCTGKRLKQQKYEETADKLIARWNKIDGIS